MTKKVAVVLSADEYAQVRKKAGLIPLSRWFKSLAFPVVSVEAERQVEKARAAGITNQTLRDAEEKMERNAEDRPTEDVPRAGNVSVSERSTPAPRGDRRNRSRTPGKLKHVEDVTHEVLRKGTCRHGLPKGGCTICG